MLSPVKTHLKESRDYFEKYFQKETSIDNEAWLKWFKAVKFKTRDSNEVDGLEKVMLSTQYHVTHALNIGLSLLGPKYSTLKENNLLREEKLKIGTDFFSPTSSTEASFAWPDFNQIYMQNYVTPKDDKDTRIIWSIDNKNYYDYVMCHELSHLIYYQSLALENAHLNVNLVGIKLLVQMHEEAENSTLKKPLENLHSNLHENFADLVGLYLYKQKYSSDNNGNTFKYMVKAISENRVQVSEKLKIKSHDTSYVLDVALANNVFELENLNDFIDKAYCLSILSVYKKLAPIMENHVLFSNLAQRVVVNHWNEYFDDYFNPKNINDNKLFLNVSALSNKQRPNNVGNYNRINARALYEELMIQIQDVAGYLEYLPPLLNKNEMVNNVKDSMKNNKIM